MHRLIRPLAVGFALFIAATVYAANVGAAHPGITLVRAIPFGDKVGHFALWGMLTAVVNLAIPRPLVSVAGRFVPIGTAVLVLVVIVEELSQLWLDNRTFDPMDLLANLFGIAVATILVGRLRTPPSPLGEGQNRRMSGFS